MAVCGTGISSISSVDGINGVILPPTQVIVEKLAEQVEFSHLAQSLRERINVIADLENGLTQVNSLVTSETGILAQELLALRDDLTGAVAYINEQTTIDIGQRQAMVESINTLMAGFDGRTAALEEKSSIQANINGALLAEKTVKVDLAGNVAGYGLSAYIDPEGNFDSDFQVRADTFSIAPPAVNSPNPPDNPYHGMVWVDTSLGVNETRWYNSENQQWSILPVKGAVPFVVKTSPETVDGVTVAPGVYIDSAYIGRIKANQIDTKGLVIRDETGKPLFGAGNALDFDTGVGGAGKPQSGATRNEIYSSNIVPSYTFVGSLWLCTADTQTYKAIGSSSPDVAVISAGQFINCTSLASSQDIIVLPFGSNEAVFSGLSSGTLSITHNIPNILTGALVNHSLNTGLIAYKDFVYFTDGYTTTTDIAKYMTDGTPFSLTAYSTTPANTANIFALASYKKDVIYRATGSSWVAYSTMGAPTGTYVGDTLAQDVESQASAQTRADAAANWAVSAAQIYAEAQANLATISAQAYADGVITAAEQRAIDAATEKANAAKEDAISAAAEDAKAKADVAATTAYWSGVSGIGKPADGATSGSNLVRKSVFSDGSMGSWNGSSVCAACHDGVGELAVVRRDTLEIGNDFVVTPGEILFAAADIYTGASSYPASAGVMFTNSAGTPIHWAGVPALAEGQDWTRRRGSFTVPENAVKATPWLQIDGPGDKVLPYVAFSRIYVGRQEEGATVGAPSGTYVGGTLAQTVESNASTALAGLENKLNKAGNEILDVGIASTSFAQALRVGSIAWDSSGNVTSGKGVAITPSGILGHNGTRTTFAIDATTGDASFGGTLNVASGTTGARMEISNSLIKIFDDNGVVRIKIGNLG